MLADPTSTETELSSELVSRKTAQNQIELQLNVIDGGKHLKSSYVNKSSKTLIVHPSLRP